MYLVGRLLLRTFVWFACWPICLLCTVVIKLAGWLVDLDDGLHEGKPLSFSIGAIGIQLFSPMKSCGSPLPFCYGKKMLEGMGFEDEWALGWLGLQVSWKGSKQEVCA